MSVPDAPEGVTRPIVFFDVTIGDTPAGRIKMGMSTPTYHPSVNPLTRLCRALQRHYPQVRPTDNAEMEHKTGILMRLIRTAENFRQLCTGEHRCVHRQLWSMVYTDGPPA